MKSELPSAKKMYYDRFGLDASKSSPIIELMEEYGRQCIAKTLEIAAEEYELIKDSDENIVLDKNHLRSLINDPRLKP